MLTIENRELEMSKKQKRKVEMICKFICVKLTITNVNINNIKGTNILKYAIFKKTSNCLSYKTLFSIG